MYHYGMIIILLHAVSFLILLFILPDSNMTYEYSFIARGLDKEEYLKIILG